MSNDADKRWSSEEFVRERPEGGKDWERAKEFAKRHLTKKQYEEFFGCGVADTSDRGNIAREDTKTGVHKDIFRRLEEERRGSPGFLGVDWSRDYTRTHADGEQTGPTLEDLNEFRRTFEKQYRASGYSRTWPPAITGDYSPKVVELKVIS